MNRLVIFYLFACLIGGMCLDLAAQEGSGSPVITVDYQNNGYTGWDGDSMEIAIARNDSVMVQRLLARGYKTDTYTAYFFKPLIRAAQLNRIYIAALLIDSGYSVNDTSSIDKTTALHEAVKNEFGPMADLLLYHGADPDLADYKGATPLMYAAGYGQGELTDMLLFYGAETGLVDPQGNDALMIACCAGSWEVAALLLDAGVEVDRADKNGFTPLMAAASFGDTTLVEMLLTAGADPKLKNSFGCDALCVCLQNKQYGIAPLLIKGGADVNAPIGLNQKPRDLVPLKSPLDSLMKTTGARRSIVPQFNRMEIDFFGMANQRDVLSGLAIGFLDPRYKLLLDFSFSSRFWHVKVLDADTGALFWQMREQRQLIMARLTRDFLFNGKNGKKLGPYLQAGLGYSWGNYKGSNSGPGGLYLFVPGAGLTVKKGNYTFRAGYSWVNLNHPEFPNGKINVGFGLNFGIVPKKIFTKAL